MYSELSGVPREWYTARKAKRHAIPRITISHKNSFQTAFLPSRLPFRVVHPLRSILQFVTDKNNRGEKRPSDVAKKIEREREGDYFSDFREPCRYWSTYNRWMRN